IWSTSSPPGRGFVASCPSWLSANVTTLPECNSSATRQTGTTGSPFGVGSPFGIGVPETYSVSTTQTSRYVPSTSARLLMSATIFIVWKQQGVNDWMVGAVDEFATERLVHQVI